MLNRPQCSYKEVLWGAMADMARRCGCIATHEAGFSVLITSPAERELKSLQANWTRRRQMRQVAIQLLRRAMWINAKRDPAQQDPASFRDEVQEAVA